MSDQEIADLARNLCSYIEEYKSKRPTLHIFIEEHAFGFEKDREVRAPFLEALRLLYLAIEPEKLP